ncbi:MAG: hypothetical protein ACK55I_12855, partial [bacterium]
LVAERGQHGLLLVGARADMAGLEGITCSGQGARGHDLISGEEARATDDAVIYWDERCACAPAPLGSLDHPPGGWCDQHGHGSGAARGSPDRARRVALVRLGVPDRQLRTP